MKLVAKYRLYVDEVGNPDLDSSSDPNHRFLCLAGVIFELDYVKKVLSPELEDLQRHFTSMELKVKSKQANIAGLQVADLIAHPARRWCFKNMFDMHDQSNTFGDQVIQILERDKFFRYNGIINSYGVKKLP